MTNNEFRTFKRVLKHLKTHQRHHRRAQELLQAFTPSRDIAHQMKTKIDHKNAYVVFLRATAVWIKAERNGHKAIAQRAELLTKRLNKNLSRRNSNGQ